VERAERHKVGRGDGRPNGHRQGRALRVRGDWRQFLDLVDEERISAAVAALQEFLGVESLAGRRFVDVGSGSGLSSLAARRLGASVVSFDFDPESVACTRELRRRHDPDGDWRVEEGSVLDREYIDSLGQFGVVYSWGVLHHTGDLWAALDTAIRLVAQDGLLWVALYNDQGQPSRVWARVKRSYNVGGPWARRALLSGSSAYFTLRGAPRLVVRKVAGRPVSPRPRGTDRRRDLVDWVGGWPFEVSKPEQVLAACRARGLEMRNLRTVGGRGGNNEYLFSR